VLESVFQESGRVPFPAQSNNCVRGPVLGWTEGGGLDDSVGEERKLGSISISCKQTDFNELWNLVSVDQGSEVQ
jgi:hypothetical protein